MAVARSREAWRHTSTLVWVVRAAQGEKGKTPADFDPYEQRPKERLPLRAYRGLFVREANGQ